MSWRKDRIDKIRQHLLANATKNTKLGKKGLALQHTASLQGGIETLSIVDSEGKGPSLTINTSPRHPELIPKGFLKLFVNNKSSNEDDSFVLSQEALSHLQFLMKKYDLGQDIFLVGPPTRLKRYIAFAFCELFHLEMEYVTITQDTTVSDLKQRREIRNGTAIFTDGPAVKSAINGRVLVLDGVEKAERNILSVLNNLLENREMNLDDGRFLTSPSRYDLLMKDPANAKNMLSRTEDVELVRVSPFFRVIAIGLPVPEYEGNSLDPPFRSRFQARDVSSLIQSSIDNQVSERLAPLVHVRKHLEIAHNITLEGVSKRLMRKAEFPADLDIAQQIMNKFPNISLRFLSTCFYPYSYMPWFDPLQQQLLMDIYIRNGVLPVGSEYAESLQKRWIYDPNRRMSWKDIRDEKRKLENVGMGSADAERRNFWIGERQTIYAGYLLKEVVWKSHNSELIFTKGLGQDELRIEVPVAHRTSLSRKGNFVRLKYHEEILCQMAILHATNLDFCVIGKRGTGKSTLVTQFANLLNSKIQYFPLYKDMTAQDLFQKRTTLANGDTIWSSSPITLSCESGGIVVLDGLDQVPSSTLAAIQSLIRDRFAQLPDGSRYISAEIYDLLLKGNGTIREDKMPTWLNSSIRLPSYGPFTPEYLRENGIKRIDPSFRIIGVARPNSLVGGTNNTQTWLTPEINSSFLPFIWVRTLEQKEEAELLKSSLIIPKSTNALISRKKEEKSVKKGALADQERERGEIKANNYDLNVSRLLELTHKVRNKKDDESKSIAGSLSTRQLIRICKRLRTETSPIEIGHLIKNACLWRFMPELAQTSLKSELLEVGFSEDSDNPYSAAPEKLKIEVESIARPVRTTQGKPFLRKDSPIKGYVSIGSVKAPIHEASNDLLVPQTLFYNNPRQSLTLQEMLIDYHLGEHLLLTGNQGVGKNKLADRFLQLLNIPRQYIQLDRDTTVNHLTSQPVVKDGVVTYEDSPLVKAAINGHTLVIDEADKAPTHVTAILKSLLADGEMLLADGRRLLSSGIIENESHYVSKNIVIIHPDFRVIVLANRPGFPFLGNDFYREIGDIFASYVVNNPDEESELELLKNYAKDVPIETLRKLTIAFQDLRKLVDENVISYPYSTRELVNIVRHMQQFPDDGMAVILQNVFDFDQYSNDEKEVITNLFQKHGIPIALSASYKVNLGNITPLPEAYLTEKWSRQEQSHAVRFKVLDIPWRTNSDNNGSFVFAMEDPERNLQLNRFEGRSTNFSEEVFSFRLPIGSESLSGPSSGVIDVAVMEDSSVLIAANDSYHALNIYHMSPPYRSYNMYQIYLPHFNFRGELIKSVRRPAPSSCTLAALKDDRCCIYIHDDQTLYVIDLKSNVESLILIPLDIFRENERPSPPGQGPGLWMERQRVAILTELALSLGILVLYRKSSGNIVIMNLASDTMTVLSLDGIFVDAIHILSPTLWQLTEAREEKAYERSLNTVEDERNNIYLLHAEGERIVSREDTYMASEDGNLFGSFSDKHIAPDPVAGKLDYDDADDNPTRITFQAMSYDRFVIEKVKRTHVTAFDKADKGSRPRRLHAEHSYISSNELLVEKIQMIQGATQGRRCMYAKGTVAQVIEGLSQTFDYNSAALGLAQTERTKSANLRSYLRTASTAFIGFKEEITANSLYLSQSSQLSTLLLKDLIPKSGARLLRSKGYFGLGHEAVLEVVDFNRESIRQIKVPLPSTTFNQRSLFSSETEEEDNEMTSLSDYDTESLNNRYISPIFTRRILFLKELLDGTVLVVDRIGGGRVYEVDQSKLEQSYESWKKMVGGRNRDEELDIDFDEEDENEDFYEEDEYGEEEYEEIEVEGEVNIVDGEISEDAEGEFVMIKGKMARPNGRRGRGRTGRRRAGTRGRRRDRGSRRGSGRNRQRTGQGRGQPGGQGRGSGVGSGSGNGQGMGGVGAGIGMELEMNVSRNLTYIVGGSGGYIPEPGQFRKLSSRVKSQLNSRLKDLEQLQKLYPFDEKIQQEIENIRARLEEANEADALEDPNNELFSRLKQSKARLEEVEKQLLQDEQNPRLLAEAEQLRKNIRNLEKRIEEEIELNLPSRPFQERKEDDLTREAKVAARELANEDFKNMMEELKLNPQELGIYRRYVDSVKQEIRELRSTLDAMEAKKHQREWIHNKDSGDLDDRKLIDGITGERNIYKRRGLKPPDPSAFMQFPKRLTFLFDVSSSMSSYAMDGRMERSLEAAVMIMESFKGYDHKFRYKFRGHSGSTDDFVFVDENNPPKSDTERLNILRAMNMHSETCASGDNTLDATKLAIKEVTKDQADEYFVFLLSDANLDQYGIEPSDLKYLLNMDQRVNLFILFIGSMGKQAERLRGALPQDKVFVTLNTSDIPKVLKRVFLSSLLKQA